MIDSNFTFISQWKLNSASLKAKAEILYKIHNNSQKKLHTKKIALAECQRRCRSNIGAVIDGSVCERPKPEQDE